MNRVRSKSAAPEYAKRDPKGTSPERRNLERVDQAGQVLYRRRGPNSIKDESPPPQPALPFPPLALPEPAEAAELGQREQDLLTTLATTGASVSLLFAEGIIAKLPDRLRLPALPHGYFFKGGAARETLRRLFFPQSRAIPCRDYDLLRFVHTDDADDHRLSLQHMSDDYEFGRGVEVVEDLVTYLLTRDLTVNEALVRPGWIAASFNALEDTLRGLFRPTPFVTDINGRSDGRTVVKAVRLTAEALQYGVNYQLVESVSPAKIGPFDLALHLDRSYAASEAVAEEYLLRLFQEGLLPPSFSAPPEAADFVRWVSSGLTLGVTFFRNLPLRLMHQLR